MAPKDGIKKENKLPGFFLKLLRWYCNSDKLEEIEGDLEEIFFENVETYGIKKSRRLFGWNVIRCCKPYAWKRKIEFHNYYFNIIMLLNYLKIARRNMLKYKTFSLINIFGLSFSMSVCLLIITIINDQLSHDSFHTNKERIYRVITDVQEKEGKSYFNYASTAMPVGDALINDYSGVEDAVRITKSLSGDAKVDDKIIRVKGIFADQGFLNVFSFQLKSGNAKKALKDPYSILLSEKTSQKFFGSENPLGNIIEIENKGAYTITGIIKDTPSKSHIKFDVVGSLSTIPILEKSEILYNKVIDKWDNPYSSYVYLLLEKGIPLSTIQKHLDEISENHKDVSERHISKFQLQKLSAITPSRLMNNAFSQTLPIEAIYALAFLAFIIIFSACFNYTNLSISRALTRAKEVGIRKVSGAMRWQVAYQFLSESILFALVSLAFALLLHNYLLGAFNQLHVAQEISMHFDENITTYLWFLTFSVITGILAGITPALFLSSFTPIKVLKNFTGANLFSRLTLRKGLIVIQFSFSLFFIITAIIINEQSGLVINSEYGFNKENIINVRLQDAKADQFVSEVKNLTDVKNASAASHVPATGVSRGVRVRRNIDEEKIRMDYFSVDHNYIENLDLKLIAGSNFPVNLSHDHEQFIILNEQATKLLKFNNAYEAIGEEIYLGDNDSTLVQVIGVVKDYNYRIQLMDIKGMGLRYIPEQFQYVHIKIEGTDTESTIAGLERAWKKHDQNHAFDYQFFDAQVEEAYGFVKDLRNIISITAMLTIIIASLGLLGMAIYNAESRTKEVGIRKVLGAKIQSIFILLSKGFFMLILIAIFIASPLAYFVNSLWLQEIALRIPIGPHIFIKAIVILFGLGLLTVGSQSLRAAIINPVNALRDE